MANALQELIIWMENRIEYYKYEHRYSNCDKEREAIKIKIIEAEEIRNQAEKVLQAQFSQHVQRIPDVYYNGLNFENE